MWIYSYKNWSHNWTYYSIPFFEKQPILGSKYLIYLDFNSAAEIIKNKEHLNPDGLGLEKILQLKNRMTTNYKSKTINNHRKD